MEPGERVQEAAVVQGCIAGDAAAWQALIAAHYAPLRSFLRWKTRDEQQADDLTQDLFLKLLQNEMRVLRAYDPSFGVSVGQYLRVVAYRLFLDWAKSWSVKQSKASASVDDLVEILSSGDAADARLLERELEERIAALPARQRTAARLRLEGLSYEEIARALGMSIGGASALLFRARGSLQRGESAPQRPRGEPDPQGQGA